MGDDRSDPRKARTRVIRVPVALRRPSPADAFAAAWPHLRALLRDGQHDYAVAMVHDGLAEVRALGVDAAAGRPTDVLIGRHARCDVSVAADSGVALRHVLLRFYRPTDGPAMVRAVDLRTELGLLDMDGEACTGAIADGDLLLRIGQYQLMAVRGGRSEWPDDAREAWGALPAQSRVEAPPPRLDPRARRPRIQPRLRAVDGDRDTITRVMHVESSVCLAGVRGDEPRAIASLHFDEPGVGRVVRLAPRDLAAGVLVGRYERCQVETVGLPHEPTVSRVHLCLLLDEEGVWAVDTASTNGSTCDGRPFRTARLGRRAVLELGGSVTARWQLA